MRDTIVFKKELLFKNNIAEISSISLECNYDEAESKVTGDFLIEGSYRSHELSLNKENFEFKVPFVYEFKEEFEKGSALVNVKDFTYTIEKDVLNIDIEYEVLADKKEVMLFEEKEEFDRFLKEHEVDVEDFKIEETSEEEERVAPLVVEDIIEENLEPEKEEKEEIRVVKYEKEEINLEPEIDEANVNDERNLSESIINEISDREDTYITYHIHICDENDTIDNISMKYKISIDTIKSYNGVENISAGMKLIIPCQDE